MLTSHVSLELCRHIFSTKGGLDKDHLNNNWKVIKCYEQIKNIKRDITYMAANIIVIWIRSINHRLNPRNLSEKLIFQSTLTFLFSFYRITDLIILHLNISIMNFTKCLCIVIIKRDVSFWYQIYIISQNGSQKIALKGFKSSQTV